MMESRDPAIKLFGMKIPFPAVFEPTTAVTLEEDYSGGDDKSPEKVLTDWLCSVFFKRDLKKKKEAISCKNIEIC